MSRRTPIPTTRRIRRKQERAAAQAEEDYGDDPEPYDDPEEDYDPYGEDEYDDEEETGDKS